MEDFIIILENGDLYLMTIGYNFQKYTIIRGYLFKDEEMLGRIKEIRAESEIDQLSVLKIIKQHKLLNYVIKNKKCADMYHLTEKEMDILKKAVNCEYFSEKDKRDNQIKTLDKIIKWLGNKDKEDYFIMFLRQIIMTIKARFKLDANFIIEETIFQSILKSMEKLGFKNK